MRAATRLDQSRGANRCRNVAIGDGETGSGTLVEISSDNRDSIRDVMGSTCLDNFGPVFARLSRKSPITCIQSFRSAVAAGKVMIAPLPVMGLSKVS